MDNNNETNSRRLGAIFLIIGWLVAIGLVAYLINYKIFATKPATVITTAQGAQLTLSRDYDSHFRIEGSINGIEVTFLVDTGSTSVAISESLAKKAGLTPGARIQSETANGLSVGRMSKIAELKLGPIELKNISVVIMPGLGDDALLGMNVLKKFTVRQTTDEMIIEVPTTPIRY